MLRVDVIWRSSSRRPVFHRCLISKRHLFTHCSPLAFLRRCASLRRSALDRAASLLESAGVRYCWLLQPDLDGLLRALASLLLAMQVRAPSSNPIQETSKRTRISEASQGTYMIAHRPLAADVPAAAPQDAGRRRTTTGPASHRFWACGPGLSPAVWIYNYNSLAHRWFSNICGASLPTSGFQDAEILINSRIRGVGILIVGPRALSTGTGQPACLHFPPPARQ